MTTSDRPEKKVGGRTLTPRGRQDYIVFVSLARKNADPKPKAQVALMSLAALLKLQVELREIAAANGLVLEIHSYRHVETPRQFLTPSMIGVCRLHGKVEAGPRCGQCGGPIVYVLIDKEDALADVARVVGRVKNTM